MSRYAVLMVLPLTGLDVTSTGLTEEPTELKCQDLMVHRDILLSQKDYENLGQSFLIQLQGECYWC